MEIRDNEIKVKLVPRPDLKAFEESKKKVGKVISEEDSDEDN